VTMARRTRSAMAIAMLGAAAAFTCVAGQADAAPKRPVRIAQAGPATKRASVATVLQKGKDMYEDQRYEESIQTLSGVVVRADASRDEKIEAYKLLTFNNIALGKNEEADAFARALFIIDESFSCPRPSRRSSATSSTNRRRHGRRTASRANPRRAATPRRSRSR